MKFDRLEPLSYGPRFDNDLYAAYLKVFSPDRPTERPSVPRQAAT